ncbi:transcription initiation factor TFIID subunit 1 [Cryptococcus neoformans c45]|nr:transcription initiation factor TFIID subunit 1 [Cryptococcus neoformans var. grubii c45]
MASEDETLSSLGSLGLGRILVSAGIDPSSIGSFLGDSGQSSKELTQVELDEDDAKFEDDISDDELPEEGEEERRQREIDQEARKREQERWMKKGLEMMKKSMEQQQFKNKKGKQKADDGKSQEERDLEEARKIWPDFDKGKRLRMSEIFYETPADVKAFKAKRKKRRTEMVKETKTFTFTVAPPPIQSLQSTFLLPSLQPIQLPLPGTPTYNKPIGAFLDKKWIREAKDRRRLEMTKPPEGLDLEDVKEVRFGDEAKDLDLVDWEQSIIMNSMEMPGKEVDILAPRNDHLESGNWIANVIWDATRISPELLESDEEDGVQSKATEKSAKKGGAVVVVKDTKLDPFNISNDPLYEHSRESKYRIRQTFGAIEVFHSMPAKILQLPYFKTTLSKSEARAWHRPALQFPTGVSLTFSKLKSNLSAALNVKKKQMMADPSEKFKTTKDLTLTEQGPFVLLEFSEEYPPIMSNYGMGTTIVNYYRKIDDKDETVPKLDFGQPSILNTGDAEPFLLGYVDRGKVTQVIHNNLIRAPIFRHKPETTDFLCIRQTVNGHVSYHLRPISNIFTVGQTVPNESEVHGPHARKNTNTAKMRLMIIAWLLINKSKQKRFKIGKLLKYFPDQTELQMRQRLKVKGNEFLMYARSPGPNQGYWMLNPDYAFPDDRRQVLEMCPPEHACLYEAMQVGARHLYDAGYKKTAEGGHEDEDEAGLDIEQRLAVWSTTHNYKLAEAQKAWLMVHGEGDPTGRGEGFSFLRANMKNYFLRKGETEQGRRLEAEARAGGNPVKISNAEQNRIYEEEKRKVWDLQASALSNPIPPVLTVAEEEAARNAQPPVMPGLAPKIHRGDSRRAFSRGTSMAATPRGFDSPRDRSPSVFSMDGGESHYSGNPLAGKVLRIKRMVKGKQQVEIVRDPAVIASYLRRVEEKKIEYYMEHPDELAPTGDDTEDELRKAALRLMLEKNKLNQQRRLMRKKYQSKTLETDNMGIEGIDLEGKRKCGACGAIGHTKANRNCPMFGVTTGNASVGPSPSNTASGHTPGYGGGFTPMTPMDTSTPAAQQSTSFKIKLGGLGGGQ